MRRIVAAAWTRAAGDAAWLTGTAQLSSACGQAADAISVIRPRSLLRHPGALIVTTLAASDVAYRLLLRDSLRRALGIEATVARAFGRPPAGRSAGARGPRR